MKRLLMILSCVVVLLVAMRPDAVRASIVYNNYTDMVGYSYNPGLLEVGDEVVLGAGPRTLSDFKFLYWGTGFSGNETVTLNIYKNDGPTGVSNHPSPGTPIYTGTPFSIVEPSPGTSLEVAYSTSTGDFVTPVNLPSSFTWSVKFGGIGAGEAAGVPLFSPPSVGQNYNTYWEYSAGAWAERNITNPSYMPASFGAQISAVPEPSAIWVPTFSALIVITARIISRRRRGPITVLDAN